MVVKLFKRNEKLFTKYKNKSNFNQTPRDYDRFDYEDMPPNFETLKSNKRHKVTIDIENMKKTMDFNKNIQKDNTKSKSFRLMEPQVNVESKRVNILHNITQSESM